MRLAGAVSLLLALAACGGGDSKPEARAVEIDTFRFTPDRLRVPVGTTVRWENRDAILHTVTAEDRSFDLQLDGKGRTASRTFEQKGTFRYVCDRHRGMQAVVEVR